MIYSNKELENIKNSLKHWNISKEQKECVKNLIEQIKQITASNNELYHFKQTTEYVLNKDSLEITKNQMEVKENW